MVTRLIQKKRTKLGQGLFNIKSNLGAIVKGTPAQQGSLAGAVQTGIKKIKESERFKKITQESPLAKAVQGKFKEIPKALKESLADITPKTEEEIVSFGTGFGVGAIGSLKKAGKEIIGEFGEKLAVRKAAREILPVQPQINTKTFKVSDEAKRLLNTDAEEVKRIMQEKTGSVLTNQEVKEYAKQSSKVLHSAVDRESTKKWEAAVYNLRTTLAEQAESGKVTQEFLDNLVALKSAGSDVARKMQSLGIEAAPATPEQSMMQALIGEIMDTGAKADDLIKAAEGVNFGNYKEAVNFYRQFVKPKMSEWIDLVRYNSMLSSPSTHIVNITSNILGSSLVRTLTKTAAGGVDFIKSTITGSARQHFSGEGWRYLKGNMNSISRAWNEASEVFAGKKVFELPDVRRIPPAVTGIKGKVVKVLSTPLRALEAADRFFTVLSEAGETAALRYKVQRGVKLSEETIQLRAQKGAVYSVFRQKPGEADQGTVLKAMDFLTGLVMRARNAENPIIRNVAKWTLPFVQTPANIVKQGIEFSPLGFTTMLGAKDMTTQFAKATIGSTVFGMSYLALESGYITGPEPTDAKTKDLWHKAGKLPWAVKIGNKWFQYNRTHPAIAFPMALISIIEDLKKNKKVDDNIVDLVLKGVSKYANFYSDQAYFKSMGDLFNAIKGDEFSLTKLTSNYPQQIVPYRALGGWLVRLFDEYERKPDYGASFIDKQLQLLMMNIPGLSQEVPAREVGGEPVKAEGRLLNAFSPIRIKEANEELNKFLIDQEQFKLAKRESDDKFDLLKDKVRPIYEEIKTLLNEGQQDEAGKLLDSLTDEEYNAYKSLKTSDKRQATEKLKIKVYPIYQEIQELLAQNRIDEAGELLDSLSEEEYKAYSSIKNSLD